MVNNKLISFSGWFKVSKGLNFDKPSPHKSIQSLTRTNSEFFLCTTNFNAIVLPEDQTNFGKEDGDDEDSEFVRPIFEGEVIRKTGIQKINQMMLPESLRSNAVDNRFLMCIDEKDNEFFIPLGQEGLFYEVSAGNLNKNDNSILQIPDILDEMIDLPLYVRHILGDPPPISKFYSPCLKLVRLKEEETVMGATLDKEEEILPLEIQTNSPIKFEIALNTPMLQSSPEYIEALDLCDTVSQNYLTDMKLAVKFKISEQNDDVTESRGHDNQTFEPETNEVPESICNSQRTSSTGMSEYGETEANSEFSIQWNPDEHASTSFRFANECSETDTDCVSLESINADNVDKFNGILGGLYVTGSGLLPNLDDSIVIPDIYGSDSEINRTLTKRQEIGFGPRNNSIDDTNLSKPYARAQVNDTETESNYLKSESEQISIQSEKFTNELDQFDPLSNQQHGQLDQYSDRMSTLDEFSSPRSVLTPPSPFKTTQTSMSSSLNSLPNALISSNSQGSSTLTISSGGSRIDLKDHFPSISSNSGSGSGSCESVSSNRIPAACDLDLGSNTDYTYTGDVFISHNGSDKFVDDQWGDRFRVVKGKDMRNRGSRKKKAVLVRRPNSRSLSDDLINFEDFSRKNNASTSGIITCQVADEMMSSYNDLRLSLEEVTKTAIDTHTENRWKDFCLERSSSLPVRSKQAEKRETTPTEDYSQSWEQISPRRNNDVDSSRRSRCAGVTSKTLKNLNSDFDSNGDEARLISDTSSEESGQMSHRSFTSEGSESVRDLFTGYLPGSDNLGEISSMDVSVQKGHTMTRDKSKLAQRIKVKKEIQRKKISEWNEVVDVI